MQVIMGGRRSGKTAELIKRSAENGIYILVSNRARASQIADQARAMGYNIPFPVTLEEYYRSHGFAGSSIRRDGLYIDDVKDVLQRTFREVEIKTFTLDICDDDLEWIKAKSIQAQRGLRAKIDGIFDDCWEDKQDDKMIARLNDARKEVSDIENSASPLALAMLRRDSNDDAYYKVYGDLLNSIK